MPVDHQNVSINYLMMLTNSLQKQGIEEQQILDNLMLQKLPERHITKRLALLTLLSHWHQAITICNNPMLPVQTGLAVHPNDYNLVGALMMNSATLEEAIRLGCQYENLMSGCFPTLRFTEQNQLLMRLSCHDYAAESIRPFVEQDFAAQIRLGNLMTNGALTNRGVEIHFRHRPATEAADYEGLLGAKVRFAMPYNQLIIPNTLLQAKIQAPCSELKTMLEKRISEVQQLIQGHSTYKIKVESFILHNLAQGIPTLEQTAQYFNMSSATLKRKLAYEETSYRQICDGIRMSIAKQLLTDPQQKVSGIAEKLDYSSPTAFISAFKRWTELTPLQFRQRSTHHHIANDSHLD